MHVLVGYGKKIEYVALCENTHEFYLTNDIEDAYRFSNPKEANAVRGGVGPYGFRTPSEFSRVYEHFVIAKKDKGE